MIMNIDEIKTELNYQAALAYYESIDIKSFKSTNQKEFIAVLEPALKAINIKLPKKKNEYLTVMIDCRIIPIIESIADDKIGIIEASRKIVKIIYELRIEISELIIFKAIDSETDHLPIGEVRNYWDKQALVKADEEVRTYEASVRNKVSKVCQGMRSVKITV